MAASALLVASLVTTAVGAGISAYGQAQAGKTQNAIAQYNAHQQERQAQAQYLTMQAQVAIQKKTAAANFAMRQAEATARFQNAKALENQALAGDAISRVNLRKKKEDYQRFQAEQRSAIAASGIVESTGTPLDLLAETAGRIQADQEETAYSNELARRTLFREADLERLGGNLALAGATLDRNSSLAEAGLRDATSRAQLKAGRNEANMTRLSGQAAQQAAKIGAIGTLIGGFGSGLQTKLTYDSR